jgi:hypothetical protein
MATTAAQATSDIRDIHPPVAIPSGWEWLWWTIGSVVALALLLLSLRYLRKRMAHLAIAPPIPAHIRARLRLEEALALISQPKPFCILVSDTIRLYLEERFDFRAPERTTGEFLLELNATDLMSADQKESLSTFLESCDLVKFAKYEPTTTELLRLHGSAAKLVEETEPRAIADSEAAIEKAGSK